MFKKQQEKGTDLEIGIEMFRTDGLLVFKNSTGMRREQSGVDLKKKSRIW